jgi:Ser/Thr protein kinase RdoA (MazF antagonist)
MGTKPVPAAWPALRSQEVARVLGAAGLGFERITWRSPRPFSAAALVATPHGSVFVKRHDERVRSFAALEEEHAFGRHLRAGGVEVPIALAAPLQQGQGVWELFAVGEGEDRYRDVPSWQPLRSVADARATGAVLARLVQVAASFAAPARAPAPLINGWQALLSEDLVVGVAAYTAERPLVDAALEGRRWQSEVREALGPFHARLLPLIDELPSGWTHGDGHPSNLLWSEEGAVASVLDLGLSDRTTPVLDLAVAIERACISWLDPAPAADLDLIDGLLEGWWAERPLSDVEVLALPELLALSHVDLALSELGYFHGITGSASDTDLAYAFLVDHGHWWAGVDGAAVRAHVHRRLEELAGC